MEDFFYKKPLKNGNTLEVFLGNNLIYESHGKWLEPLFHLEDSDFKNKINNLKLNGKNGILSCHDTAVGKAAVVLMIRAGIRAIYGNVVSKLAVECVEKYNFDKDESEKVSISWGNIVPSLLCATEKEFAQIEDFDFIYFRLRQRAKKTCGVTVDVSSINYPFGNIHNLSFHLEPGSHLMILGENGAGKTTLLRLLGGIYKPESGEILIDGKKISKLEKGTIGYIPQENEKNDFSLSVEEVVGLGTKVRGRKKSMAVDNALKSLGALDLKYKDFNRLSGGEKQKVNIARCLCQNGKLLLMDEPTASLHKEAKNIVKNIIKSLTITEIPTIIISTHDEELANLPGWEILEI